MIRTITHLFRPRLALTAAASVLAVGAAASSPVTAAPPGGWGGPGDVGTPVGCQVADRNLFDVSIATDGEVTVAYPQDGHDTCDESVVIQTWSSNGVTVDQHAAPPLGAWVTTVSDLEAAGPSGLSAMLPMDPCYTAVTVHRDGDTLVHDDIVGDGCEMTIVTDFAGAGHDAEIHVVQQTGIIAPPHFVTVDEDDTTVLTGLPNGTWYVKVFDGWNVGSSITVDGGPAQPASTVYDVEDGSTVEIDLTSWKITRLTSELSPIEVPSIRPLVLSSGLTR